jgi:UDP-N-acetyl-D-glucosamine/UDP-N-acetyl-D-galactosamine dehydrogenase
MFCPGLVGGHCIGGNPHQLTNATYMTCNHLQVIPAGRGIDDGMDKLISARIVLEW